MKKIVLAIDSFKGCISSADLTRQIIRLCSERFPELELQPLFISDGGEGLTEAIAEAGNTRKVCLSVHDPLMRKIESHYLTVEGGRTAILEMASAAGLPLLAPEERNPLFTTTYGVGEMIVHALNSGCRHILMGIGGSATNDAGTGMLQALGFRFSDKHGNELPGIGASLEKITGIDSGNIHSLLKEATFEVACDVNNPFYGKDGAACVFAPQKGADPQMVRQLDRGLRRFAKVIHTFNGSLVGGLPGAGAAGGLGGCLAAVLGAKLRPGIDLILDYIGFDGYLNDARLIITGEGRMDKQTLMGKAPYGVLLRGKQKGIPVIGLAGRIDDRNELASAGFSALFEVSPRNIPLSQAMNREVLLENIRQTLFRPELAVRLLNGKE